MMLLCLREEMRRMLAEIPVQRPPALRRSGDAGFLLATDLPLCAAEDAVQAFMARAESTGWRMAERDGWLLMDHDLHAPVLPEEEGLPGELGCCLSLLQRHPENTAIPADMLRALAKAEECGEQAVTRLCGQWHRDWAEKLRRREALPGGLKPCLMWVAANTAHRRKT